MHRDAARICPPEATLRSIPVRPRRQGQGTHAQRPAWRALARGLQDKRAWLHWHDGL